MWPRVRKSVLAAAKIHEQLSSGRPPPTYSFEDAVGRAFMAANIINGMGSITQVGVAKKMSDPSVGPNGRILT